MTGKLLVALAACAFIAGCGGSSTTQTTQNVPDTTVTQPPSTTPASQAPGAGDGVGGVKLTKLGTFDSPVHITQPPVGKELYVVEQTGRIRVIGADGKALAEPFLDVTDDIASGGEQGLLSMAFAPDYAKTGLFYVDYTDENGDTRVVSYQASNPLRADPSSAHVILKQDQPYPNHNGGQLQFGPDGALYVGFGDGGSEDDPDRTGQDPSTFLGKIVRIADPAQANPKPEIFITGTRNPWRFSFDRKTGDLWIGDVGQSEQEEVDHLTFAQAEGANLGWSAYEGDAVFNPDQVAQAKGAIKPVNVQTHEEGNCSITGGYLVRDKGLPSLYGRYLFADFCKGELESLDPSDPAKTADLGLDVASPSSFGEDSSGRVYAVSLEGSVYRLDPK